MGCLCSFLHWASQVQTCLILMSLPIPIKRLSESLFTSLCQSLSLWSSSTPAPNIWWVDKTSSRVSAWHSRMEMTMAMQRWCCKSFFWSIHTCCDWSIQAYWRGIVVIIYYFRYFYKKLLWFKVLEFITSNTVFDELRVKWLHQCFIIRKCFHLFQQTRDKLFVCIWTKKKKIRRL